MFCTLKAETTRSVRQVFPPSNRLSDDDKILSFFALDFSFSAKRKQATRKVNTSDDEENVCKYRAGIRLVARRENQIEKVLHFRIFPNKMRERKL
jgi:hypothetical protein